eukprot:gb/GFBE01029742.1/.p1 GENE.gb/GFBE01029742.1/~~gb/GFBE01029742.1/.p1  ORF type:complete len:454 (+),score=101.95 gb/GFBE01029742.1/:1-1362(+)
MARNIAVLLLTGLLVAVASGFAFTTFLPAGWQPTRSSQHLRGGAATQLGQQGHAGQSAASSVAWSAIACAAMVLATKHGWRNRCVCGRCRSHMPPSGGFRPSRSSLHLPLLLVRGTGAQNLQKHDREHVLEELVHEQELLETTRSLCLPGKGLLALDELRPGTGFEAPSAEACSRFREMVINTEGLAQYFSGVILPEEAFESTLHSPQQHRFLVGASVDRGQALLQGGESGETWTQGLDGLQERSQQLFENGARFAKWRAAVRVKDRSKLAVAEAAHGLAHFASICQSAGLVPVLEIQILRSGAHTMDEALEAFEEVLIAVFKALVDFDVMLEATLLMPSLVLPGKQCPERGDPEKVSAYTMAALRRHVPPALPAIMLLSEEMPEMEASSDLAAMNKWHNPWEVSFAYACDTGSSAWQAWRHDGHSGKAQERLLEVARANSSAQLGVYATEEF